MKLSKIVKFKQFRSLNIPPWLIGLLLFLSPISFLSFFVTGYFYEEYFYEESVSGTSVLSDHPAPTFFGLLFFWSSIIINCLWLMYIFV